MTRAEFHKYFKIAMDKSSQSLNFGGCPAFLDDEIDYWLNLGLYQEISNKLTGNNSLKLPFEGSIKRIHDLEKLVRTDKNINAIKDTNSNACTTLNLFNGTRMFFVSAILNFGNKRANINIVDHDTAKKFKQTYNNTPWLEEPMAVIENNSIITYIDPISMIDNNNSYSLDITYIKFPTKILDLPNNGMTELPENVLFEVINRAVELALEDIESRRVLTKVQLNLIDE